MSITIIIDCPNCKKEIRLRDEYDETPCPFCGYKITLLPQGEMQQVDPRCVI